MIANTGEIPDDISGQLGGACAVPTAAVSGGSHVPLIAPRCRIAATTVVRDPAVVGETDAAGQKAAIDRAATCHRRRTTRARRPRRFAPEASARQRRDAQPLASARRSDRRARQPHMRDNRNHYRGVTDRTTMVMIAI